MGANGATDMDQILGAIQALGACIERLEQPPAAAAARQRPIRAVNGQQNQLGDDTDDDMPPLEDNPPLAPNLNQRRRHNQDDGQDRERERGRDREDDERPGSRDIKLTAPTFVGKVTPDAYLDWERRMEYIFEYYRYSETRKVSLAAVQLTENALAWWDRDLSERRRHRHGQIATWEDMRFSLRKRYVPYYYHRDLQRRFRKLTQGNKSVEDYFDEFETIKNRLEIEDREEGLMAQFIDGLQDRIATKVERQSYHDMDDLLHLAVQAEQHIKKKTLSTNRSKTTWTPQPPKVVDKGKSIEIDNRFKKTPPEAYKESRPEPSKFPNQRSRDITCFKCQGKGHISRDCSNRRTMIITSNGDYESQDEEEPRPEGSNEDIVDYPESGELLATMRVLSSFFEPQTIQIKNIFHSR